MRFHKAWLLAAASLGVSSIKAQDLGEGMNDEAFLSSRQDYLNPDYGFSSSEDAFGSKRRTTATEYANAKSSNGVQENYDYWTRSRKMTETSIMLPQTGQ